MTQLSIAEASKLVSRDRKTLYRLIKEGKLSATTSDTGGRQVETSELIRVFGEMRQLGDSRDSRATVSMPQDATVNETVRIAVLEVELRHARDMLAAKDAILAAKDGQIDDLRQSIRLLGAPEKSPQPKKPFWPWSKT